MISDWITIIKEDIEDIRQGLREAIEYFGKKERV
jgi:hypothetical protein